LRRHYSRRARRPQQLLQKGLGLSIR
jgi:hypothetical protein